MIKALGGVVVAVLLAATSAGAAPRDPRLADVETFAFAIGDFGESGTTVERLQRHDLVVLDGEQAVADTIEALQDDGVIVLGYLSVGTIEPWRSWYADAKLFRLEHWDDWDEWFADTSSEGFRDLMLGEIAPTVLDRGFDGLFLDNLDMIEAHDAQRDGMVALVQGIADLVHENDGVVFAQNGDTVIAPFLPMLDGWNREDVTGSYDFDEEQYVVQRRNDTRAAQHTLRLIAEQGILVTATDYVPHKARATIGRAVKNACAAGAIPYVADIALARIPRKPFRC